MQYVQWCTNENLASGLPQPPPTQETYTVFGSIFQVNDSISQTLESQGVKQLYPDKYNTKKEMKKLNHSLLVCFLDLLDILVQNPNSPERIEKLNDMSLLFINLHHLINGQRSHQANETLRMLLMKQKRQALEMLNRFQENLTECEKLIAQSIENLPVCNPDECEAFKLTSKWTGLKDSWEISWDSSTKGDTVSTMDVWDMCKNAGKLGITEEFDVKCPDCPQESKVIDFQTQENVISLEKPLHFEDKVPTKNTEDVQIDKVDILSQTSIAKDEKFTEFLDSNSVVALEKPIDFEDKVPTKNTENVQVEKVDNLSQTSIAKDEKFSEFLDSNNVVALEKPIDFEDKFPSKNVENVQIEKVDDLNHTSAAKDEKFTECLESKEGVVTLEKTKHLQEKIPSKSMDVQVEKGNIVTQTSAAKDNNFESKEKEDAGVTDNHERETTIM